MTVNDQLTRAVEEKTSSKRQSARPSSADHREKSEDVTFTDDSSPFHLWYSVSVSIGDGVYESTGHYLVEKSLGKSSYNMTLKLQSTLIKLVTRLHFIF